MLYERDVDGPGIARIRSKGDAALFGGKDTKAMKESWGVPANRPLADFAPEIAVVANQLATATRLTTSGRTRACAARA
ncbi:MAG: hypothetical protein WAN86_03515 [Hyphomicrobiaceae bacterium]